ncbi:hypothetical protein ACHHYP_05018 [Achlya hypogyna]|uniref:Fe2OG dioxygenase domain-containing protein n=1 Tax=Achlya hypogyna TaxID=1202772 RepID=A0A1V9YZC2_ACHHY|nr:hypothetical protein ACHHYP_05018 [Achlya hypogyna]
MAAVGSTAMRVLDDMFFPCTIESISYADGVAVAWTIRYMDDGTIECITDLDELVLGKDAAPPCVSLPLVFDQVAPFLTPWEHATVIRNLSKDLRALAMQAHRWLTLVVGPEPPDIRLDRYLHWLLHLPTDAGLVKTSVTTLKATGLHVTDRDVGYIIRQCPRLLHLGLAYCPLVSYQIFPLLQFPALQLGSLDLYMTRVVHWEMLLLKAATGDIVEVYPSGLVPFRVAADILAAATHASHATMTGIEVCFVDTIQLDATAYVDDDWGAKHAFSWSRAILPVVRISGETFVFRSEDDMTRWLTEKPQWAALLATPRALRQRPEKAKDPLDEQAKLVFASLQEWKESLESQVNALTVAFMQAQEEHRAAKDAYDTVERQRVAVEQQANRAVLALSMGRDSAIELVITTFIGALLWHRDMGRALQLQHFVVWDGLLGHTMAMQLYDAVVRLHQVPGDGLAFERGALAGGKTGRNLRYEMSSVRGDDVLWLDGTESSCPPVIVATMRQIDRLVLERLGAVQAELQRTSLTRQRAMVTCYPGQGASYIKHCDNPNGNGRKITAILYLNPHWTDTDGGELMIHRRESALVTIEPVLDRLVLFFSDARVPHQVAPTAVKRFALTVWYMDWDEYMAAQLFTDECTHTAERAKIESEIRKFES